MRCADQGQIACWNLECRDTENECPCPANQVRCDGVGNSKGRMCVSSVVECPSFEDCKSPYSVQCGDGTCKESADECPPSVTCPPGAILCPDSLYCALDESQCIEHAPCPITRPQRCMVDYSCSDAAQQLCPTPPSCERGLYLCPDKSCVQEPKYCKRPKNCPGGKLCPDGQTCVSNSSTSAHCPKRKSSSCSNPTQVICGEKCVDSVDECTAIQCKTDEYLCANGACVRNRQLCPTETQCEGELSTKCDDGSCVKQASDCPNIHPPTDNSVYCPMVGGTALSPELCPSAVTCASNEVKCADGSCASNSTFCNQEPTERCPDSKPIRCDGSRSCVSVLSDCPDTKRCSKNEVLCDDGNCRSSPVECAAAKLIRMSQNSGQPNQRRLLQQTSPRTHVCPDKKVVTSSDLCGTLTSCRSGYLRCSDGSCRNTSIADTKISCPVCNVPECKYSTHQCVNKYDKLVDLDLTEKLCDVSKGEVFCLSSKTCQSSREECKGVCSPNSSGCARKMSSSCDAKIGRPGIVSYYTKTPKYRALQQACEAGSVENCRAFFCLYQQILKFVAGACTSEMNTLVLAFKDTNFGSIMDAEVQEFASNPNQLSATCSADMVGETIIPTDDNSLANFVYGNDQLRVNPFLAQCWTGDCVQVEGECPSSIPCPTCPDKITSNTCALGQVSCSNGECREKFEDCPTLRRCPNGKVLCDNGMCAANRGSCPVSNNCPDGLKQCPDGTCTQINSRCGTPLTCPRDRPFKCTDNTCRTLPDDCPTPPTCGFGVYADKPFLCPLGYCAKNRLLCHKQSVCEKPGYGRYLNGECYKNMDEYIAKGSDDIRRCPGMYECADGSCAFAQEYCNSFTCPEYLPHVCPSGKCAVDEEQCNEISTDCPKSARLRCQTTGQCYPPSEPNMCPPSGSVAIYAPGKYTFIKPKDLLNKGTGCYASSKYPDQVYCENMANYTVTVLNCPTGTQRCGDGTCERDPSRCKMRSGCPKDSPVRCIDGSCASRRETCGLDKNFCPKDYPHKCYDGACVASVMNCPKHPSMSSVSDPCKNSPIGNILCASGVCVASSHQCPLVKPCADKEKRCPDGSCAEFCPIRAEGTNAIVSFCPPELPHRCTGDKIGRCAESAAHCVPYIKAGSTQKTPTCPYGKPYRCDSGECVLQSSECKTLLPNGCPVEKPNKCEYGACVVDISTCDRVNGCPATNPFRCPNGSCLSDMSLCDMQGKCSKVKCPDGACVDSENKCVTKKERCPLNTPIRCPDGTCVKASGPGGDSCQPRIKCFDNKPFVCADGSCASSKDFCRSVSSVPTIISNPFWTNGRLRVLVSAESTGNSSNSTNTSSQPMILKPSGKLFQQAYSFSPSMCPPTNPTLCQASGICVEAATACLKRTSTCPSQTPFVCYDGTCALNPKGCISTTKAMVDANGAHTCLDTDTPHLCSDGSCRKNMNECPSVVECPLDHPFRCIDGSCSRSRDSCLITAVKCKSSDNEVCADGLCRAKGTCPSYHGCIHADAPFLCPSGKCAQNMTGCSGGCEPGMISCFDGSCVNSASSCPSRINHAIAESVTYTIARSGNDVHMPMVSHFGQTIVSGIAPSGSIISNHSITPLMIRPVYHSVVRSWINQVPPSRAHEYGFTIPFERTLMTPAVNIIVPDLKKSEDNPNGEFRYGIRMRHRVLFQEGTKKARLLSCNRCPCYRR